MGSRARACVRDAILASVVEQRAAEGDAADGEEGAAAAVALVAEDNLSADEVVGILARHGVPPVQHLLRDRNEGLGVPLRDGEDDRRLGRPERKVRTVQLEARGAAAREACVSERVSEIE